MPVEYVQGQLILKNKVQNQIGKSINNNIQINNKDLDKGVLRIRYSNNRKLTNKLLKKWLRL